MTESQRFSQVWDALENTPEQAAIMRLRSSLMMAIMERVNGWEGTAADRARRLAITSPRYTNLKGGKIDEFSLDDLVALADAAGLEICWSIRTKAT